MSPGPLRRNGSLGGFVAVVSTAIAAVAVKGALSVPPERPVPARVGAAPAPAVAAAPRRTVTTITTISARGRRATRTVTDAVAAGASPARRSHATRRSTRQDGATATRRGSRADGSSPAARPGAAGAPTAAAPSPTAPATASETARTIEGDVESTTYGPVQVAVVLRGTTITDVLVRQIQDKADRSREINADAIPKLRQQVLDAQSAAIDGVSGATITADAYALSVQSALDRS